MMNGLYAGRPGEKYAAPNAPEGGLVEDNPACRELPRQLPARPAGGVVTGRVVVSNENTAAVLDTALGLHSMNGNVRLYCRLLKVYRDESAINLPALRSALAEGDAESLEHLAHRLKGGSGTLGLPGVQQAAQALELAAKQGAAAEQLTPLLRSLEELQQQGIQAIAEYLAQADASTPAG